MSSSSAVKYHAFKNGFRLIYQHSEVNISYIYVFCLVGSNNETDGKRGISHFIEHMIFKGSKKYPSTAIISRAFDQVGAEFNAFTTKHITCYEVRCPSSATYTCLNIIGDILLHAVFDRAEYEKEYNVVVEENTRNTSDNSILIDNELGRSIYDGNPYAWPVDDISYHRVPKSKRYSYEDVLAYYRQYYTPNNMTVSIVSNCAQSDIIGLLERTQFVGKIPVGIEPRMNVGQNIAPILRIHTDKGANADNYIKYIRRPIDTVYLGIGFRVCSLYDMDSWALTFLKTVLSGPLSARLFHLLREEHGLTYESAVITEFMETAGNMYIYIITDRNKLLKNGANKKGVFPIITDEIRHIITAGISAQEVKTTKEYIRNTLLMEAGDNFANVAYNNGFRAAVCNETAIVPMDKIYDHYYSHITAKQVNAVARKYMTAENMSICMIGKSIAPAELRSMERMAAGIFQ